MQRIPTDETYKNYRIYPYARIAIVFISILLRRKLFRKCTKNSVIDFLDIHKIQYYASFNRALDNMVTDHYLVVS